MQKFATIIMKYKKSICVFMFLLMISSAFLIPKVKVNYDMSNYLPKNSDVAKGLTIMGEEFDLIDSARVMVENSSPEECIRIKQILLNIEGVEAVDFDITDEHYYKDNHALFSLTLKKENGNASKALDQIRASLHDESIYLDGPAVNVQRMNHSLQNEMPIFLGVAMTLILIVLLSISNSWLEPLLFLSTSAIAIIMNYGTNIFFHEISFVTFAIAALLQLALSMDYSIMLLDQYHHELKEHTKEEAMTKAWKKSFRAISASSLTTIFGLLAMIFMSFTIGRDLGIVLAKGILINVFVVFFALPPFILLTDNLLNKTKKKALIIPTKFLAKQCLKKKYIISILVILSAIGAFFIQSKLTFSYSLNSSNAETKKIENTFGSTNQFILLYQEKEATKVTTLLSFLQQYQHHNQNVVTHILDYQTSIAMPVSIDDLKQFTNLDREVIEKLYQAYDQFHQSQSEQIPLIDLLTFLESQVQSNPTFISLITNEQRKMVRETNRMLKNMEQLLVGKNYRRMIIKTNTPIESKEADQFYQDFNQMTKQTLRNSYLLGETPLANSIHNSFADETLLITMLTIGAMLLVIAITYRSIGLPIILVTLIQAAIWISLCYPVFMGNRLFFLAYIIVQCIQMGATIDYAILLSSNYLSNRKKHNKKEAIENALKASIMTIFTSATILIVAAFTIAFISSQEMISTICMVIGRGTIISSIMVLIGLPSCLILCDRFLEKTTWRKPSKKTQELSSIDIQETNENQ